MPDAAHGQLTAATASRPLVLASAGVGVIGVSFGMARYGFGLLAPDIRASFSLSSGALGVLAAASYVTYLATSVLAGLLTIRLGPRVIVAAGGTCAVVGMTVAGLAQSPLVLFAGLLVAGASAGLVFPPLSEVVADRLTGASRTRVLATISSGTGFGVCAAAPVALLVGSDWRAAWLLFALIAALATAWALFVLPGPLDRDGVAEPPRLRPSWLICPRSGPLLASAFAVGVASSVYWTFAVDHVKAAGGLSTGQSRVFLAVVGAGSVLGAVTGDLVGRLGGRATFTLALVAQAAALVVLGLAPTSFAVAGFSGVLFGAAYNSVVSVQVIWGGHVYAARPSAGLAGVMIMLGLGLLIGPPALGAAADGVGFPAVFCAAGALTLATMALAPREPL